LLQKSGVNADLTLNIFSTWLNFKSLSSWYIDGGGGIGSTKVARSKDTSSVITPNWFIETGINLRSSENIGVDAYVRMIDQFSPSTPWDDKSSGVVFFRIGAEAYYSSLSDKANRIFGRINYTVSTKQEDKRNHFFQFQIGYSLLLSNVLKK